MPRRIPRPHTPDGMPDSDCEACPCTPDGKPESDYEDGCIVHAVPCGGAGGAKPVAGNNRSAATPKESLYTSSSCHLPDTWPSNASLLTRTHTAFVEIGGDEDFEMDAAQADANGQKASAAHTKVCEDMQAQLNAGSAQTMEAMKEEQMEAELGYSLMHRQQEKEKRKQEDKEASLRKRQEEGDVEFAYTILRKLLEGESGQQKEGDLRSSNEGNVCYGLGSAPLHGGEEDGKHTRGKRLQWKNVDPGHPCADELDLYATAPESWRHTVAQTEIQLEAHNKEIMNQVGLKQHFGEEMASVTAPLTRMVCAHVFSHVVLKNFCTCVRGDEACVCGPCRLVHFGVFRVDLINQVRVGSRPRRGQNKFDVCTLWSAGHDQGCCGIKPSRRRMDGHATHVDWTQSCRGACIKPRRWARGQEGKLG